MRASLSHVGPIVVGDFPQERNDVAAELGGQPRKVSWILTFS
jgi:hypothetical protein